ncbi:MAG: aldehyde dehydrogenase family protein [Amylibacter sp.]
MSILEILNTMDYGPAPESSEAANVWLDRHDRKFGHFINGAFTAHAGSDAFATANPANGQELALISQGSADNVDAAVAAARKAQKGWAATGGAARARILYALARLVQKHARLLSVLETMDNGKPIRESRDIDIPLVARHFYHHAGWAQLMDREFPDFEAVGVAGQVIPWNFPLLMLAWKIAPALAMGNTVVLKPAEYTPLTALLFAEICQEAGVPKGVVNIVTGDGRTGALIVEHDDVDKVAFTGSTPVGRIIRERIAGSGKKLTLELGGKSPFIVFDDADLDSAVEGVVDAIWFNQGQVCCAGSRLLLHEPIAKQMITKLRDRMAQLRVGDPLDKCTDIGAIVHPKQLKQISAKVDRAVAAGATLFQPAGAMPSGGSFYPPTLLTDVETADEVAQEEIFGPVQVAMTFRTPDEAVALANNTRFGLSASIWTENINLALGVAPRVESGIVWINCTNVMDAAAGFGGVRESGFGREGGREGLYEYMKPRYLKSLKPIAERSDKPRDHTATVPNGIDRTAKMYIGGKQARPDGGYSRKVLSPKGKLVGQVADGNRKDIRNAVEAAQTSSSWSGISGHGRAQVLYFVAENLAARQVEFSARLQDMTGASTKAADREVQASIDRLFTYAAWADKYDGAVHSIPMRGTALAMKEPNGVMALVCPDEAPLLAFVSLLAPTLAMGNRAVIVPSEIAPLCATDFYQVLDTSDMPAGTVNIVTGGRDELTDTLAKHAGVDALWYHGSAEGSRKVEMDASANMKRTWVNNGLALDWTDPTQGESDEFLRNCCQIKNVWVPYGE